MAQIFTTSQHVLRVLQTSISSFTKSVFRGTLVREDGETSLWKLNGVTLFVRKKSQITGKFFIKNVVLGVPRWKKPKFFPIRYLVYFVYLVYFTCLFYCCSWNVYRSGLILRNLNLSWKVVAHLVDQHGWLIKEIWILDQLEHSLFQLFHTF